MTKAGVSQSFAPAFQDQLHVHMNPLLTSIRTGAASSDAEFLQGLLNFWCAVVVRGGKAEVVITPEVEAPTAGPREIQRGESTATA